LKIRIFIYIGFLIAALGAVELVDRPVSQSPAEKLAQYVSAVQNVSEADRLLADSLLWIFKGMTVGVKYNRPEVFGVFLDPEAEGLLQIHTQQYGYSSLKAYLATHANAWPDPDTLIIYDLVSDSLNARLCLAGPGYELGSRRRMIRYTFLLYRHSGLGWRLAAISLLDKPVVDQYGHRVGYHDMELPPKFRFPRLF
jgi:hypothetical protein